MACKERPILFSGPMVRAILAGTKTQTRRVAKLRDPSSTYVTRDDDGWPVTADEAGVWHRDICPYGQPGDRLWVRETWGRRPEGPGGIIYRAEWTLEDEQLEIRDWPWRPSIHMPRWASRITLEITETRVERLQAISKDDAKAEGIAPFAARYPEGFDRDGYIAGFAQLWDSINCKRPGCTWSDNPWVWALTFRRLN